jgi:hypothetical protein
MTMRDKLQRLLAQMRFNGIAAVLDAELERAEKEATPAAPRDIAFATLPPALWALTYVIARPATMHFPPVFLMAMVFALTALMLARPWRWRTPVSYHCS